MKKSNLIKVVLVLGISLMVMLFSTSVMAANEIDLSNTIDNSSSPTSNTGNSNSNSNNSNSNSNRTNNTNTNRTNNTNTNNSSIYNNTSLPKTGIESSLPIALIVVVLGISAVYAYKKIKDYRNI